MRALLTSVWIGLALAAAVPAGANGEPGTEACVAAAVERVQKRYEGIRDLRARFSQVSRSVALGERPGGDAASTGSVAFAKPGKMRWSYEAPEESLVVSDGETLWIYDPARREAQRLPMAEAFASGAAIQFLLGEGDILREFEVASSDCGSEAVDLELLPREPASYERLGIRVDLASGDVVRTTITDLLGNRTEVSFTEIESDFGAAPELFRFDPPEGVRVLELAEPTLGGAQEGGTR